jgi:hypothetical protein
MSVLTVPPSRQSRSPRPALAVHHGPEEPTPPTGPTLDPASLVVALEARREAVVPLATLAADLGIPEATAARLANEAAALDWAECWNAPGDDGGTVPSVILSALSAEAAGLELDETGESWRPVGTRSKTDPDPWRAKRGRVYVGLATDHEFATRSAPDTPNAAATLERLAPDYRDRLEPWDAADAILTAERIAATNARRDAQREAGGPRLPRLDTGPTIPRLILGLGIAWPPRWEAGAACPGCGGKRLPSLAYCAVCDVASNEARTDAAAARRAKAITTPPKPAPVAAYAPDDARTADETLAAVDAPEGLVGGLGRTTPPPTGKAGRKGKPSRSAAVLVKLLRPMGNHAAGDVITLRPSIAAAYQAVGAAMPIAART